MIDIRLLLEDFEATARRLERKQVDRALLVEARDLAERRKSDVRAVDEARAQMNVGAASVGRLLREGRQAEADERKAELARARGRIDALEAALRITEADLEDVVLRIPNVPSDEAPEGKSEEDNVVVRTEGYRSADYEGRSYEPHWEVASRMGILDGERATKLSGGMFSVLQGDGARLLRALVAFGLDLHRDRYTEIVPPHLVRTEVIQRTGHLTGFETQAYRLRDDELWLVPTAEVPLMGLHQGEILDEADLPRRYVAATVCWRREAGAAGKDTRGMQRLHEFHKVELVELCRPEDGEAELQALVGDAERALQALHLPYRVLELCAGDLTFSASRVYDLEVRAGVDRWLEVSSISLVTDFQARRGSIRFRREESGRVEYAHSLNGSALATPRVWAAIVEHGEQSDGTVRIPEVLRPYLGGQEVLQPAV